MPSWGANTNDESKPKWLTEEQKAKTYATERGWEYIGDNGVPEVLVAINNLSGGSAASSKLATATISAVYFLSTAYDTQKTAKVRIVWNERITPTTTGTIIVKRYMGTSIVNITATRVGNTTSNFVDFSFTTASSTGTVYTIPAQTITLGVNDYGTTSVTSQLVIVTSAVVRATAAASGSTSVTVTA